jgi:TPP-dependent pyruvate/acetoin dehydrogenase alpha subunit
VSYGIPGEIVDGQDVEAVFACVDRAVSRARLGQGPTLIEAKTYRFMEHSAGAKISRQGSYRTREEIDDWKLRDPIVLYRSRLISDHTLDEHHALEIEAAVKSEVNDAVTFARESPYPDPDDLYTDMYASPVGVTEPRLVVKDA